MKKKMTNISQKRDYIHLNGCDNDTSWGKPFQITVILKHNVMSDTQQLHAHITSVWDSQPIYKLTSRQFIYVLHVASISVIMSTFS